MNLRRLRAVRVKKNRLLVYAAGVNTCGRIGSIAAAAVMLSALKGMGLI